MPQRKILQFKYDVIAYPGSPPASLKWVILVENPLSDALIVRL